MRKVLPSIPMELFCITFVVILWFKNKKAVSSIAPPLALPHAFKRVKKNTAFIFKKDDVFR